VKERFKLTELLSLLLSSGDRILSKVGNLFSVLSELSISRKLLPFLLVLTALLLLLISVFD